MPAKRRVALMTAALLLAAPGCATSDGGDPAPPAARRQAEEKLHDYGLTKAQAACVVDRLGADTVVEADDVGALVQSGPYQTAAKACTSGG